MSDFLDVGQFKQGKEGKWRFVKMGYAKDDGKGGLKVYMDALPLTNAEGFCNLSIVPQKERDNASPGARQISQTPDDRAPFDSDAPF